MRDIIDFPILEVKPESSEVLNLLGIPPHIKPSKRILDLYNLAIDFFLKSAIPKGILTKISVSEFSQIYSNNSQVEVDTPLKHIFPKADLLSLFAFTLGSGISNRITEFFREKEFPLGSMLDAVASSSANKAIQLIEMKFSKKLNKGSDPENSLTTLLYSPGYCGWGVNGQKKLFEFLKPEEIGIILKDSFIMVPLKSVSGILVCGNKNIHYFNNNFPFCSDCDEKSCIKRMKGLKQL